MARVNNKGRQASKQSSQGTLQPDSPNTIGSDSLPIDPTIIAPPNTTPTPGTTPNPPPDAPVTPTENNPPPVNQQATTPTLRQQLLEAHRSPKHKKRKRLPKNGGELKENTGGDDSALQRKLDRLGRWNCFLHFTNKLWDKVAVECYGNDFDVDSDLGQGVRLKIFDWVKNYKNKVLKLMEEHVSDILEAPENTAAKTLYTTRPLLMDFFSKIFTPLNFFAVWKYMEGYLDYDNSTDLGKYYIKSIYVNLAIEVKLWMDARSSPGGLEVRERLLKFYDQIPTHANFEGVDKGEFREIQKRYRNQHNPADRGNEILKECFTSLGAPPAKKQQTVGPLVEAQAQNGALGEAQQNATA